MKHLFILVAIFTLFPILAIAGMSAGGGVSGQNPGQVPAYISTGKTFTTTTGTSCGTVGTLTGGATAGTYVSGTSGTCAIVLLFGIGAPNGWSCFATDITTTSDAQHQTAATATTATITGTTASADVVSFHCIGY